MGFVPFQNTVKLTAIFTYDAQRVVNVHHYILDETVTADDATEVAEAYITWWTTQMRGNVSNALGLVQVEATIMENENDPSLLVTTGLPSFGSQSQEGLPANVTAAVKWTTDYKGRSYRGRTYHLGLVEGQVSFNTLAAGTIAALTPAYQELMALSYSGGPAVMGIASRFHNGVERTFGVITPVRNCVIDPTVDSQRRRLPGRGR